MGVALYRKYRSKSLDEIVAQEHITTTLKRALKSGNINHAYLFTGPRGVGKTSVARILAYAVNNLPYDEGTQYLDIIEIDAASNRRIDEIRELRDKIHIAPAQATYKVYIIDEAHMLTKEAFNALLKTLEEPPAHAIFILATTEAHKLPATIVSRCVRFTFKPVAVIDIVNHLKYIANSEKIKITEPALHLLAEHAEGSLRDSISLLDRVSGQTSTIDVPELQKLLGIAPAEAVQPLLEAAAAGSSKEVIDRLNTLSDQGVHPGLIAKQLGSLLRSQIGDDQLMLQPTVAMKLLSKLLAVTSATDAYAQLELALLEATLQSTHDSINKEPVDLANNDVTKPTLDTEKVELRPSKQTHGHQSLTLEIWPEVLQIVKQRHNTLYSILRMAEPKLKDNTLTLVCRFPFHQKRLNESKNRDTITEVIEGITDSRVEINCVVDSSLRPPNPKTSPPKPASNPALESITNIFGSAEVLES